MYSPSMPLRISGSLAKKPGVQIVCAYSYLNTLAALTQERWNAGLIMPRYPTTSSMNCCLSHDYFGCVCGM